jgi:two-component system alkaline phosphatase synthesis response regulator PhoP
MPDSPGVGVPSRAGPLALFPQRGAVVADGQEILLTGTQFRLLAVLCGEPGRVFSRAELVERGIGDVVGERTVDVHIKEIRRRLGGHGELIETVRRAGYRFRG